MQVLAKVTETINSRQRTKSQFLLTPKPVLEETSLNTGVTTKDEREARAQSPFGNGNQYSQGQRSTSRVATCTRPSASSLGQQGAVVRGEASGIPKPRWTGQDSVREGNGSHDRLWS